MSKLREHYLDYIEALNEHRFDELVHFVAEELTYNGQPMSRLQYQRDRRAELTAIPDLHFAVDLLVVDGEFVGCKLDFNCTPVQTFQGFAPSGNRIHFTEHVFYRFVDGRIVAVTSLLDLAAIERQSGGAS